MLRAALARTDIPCGLTFQAAAWALGLADRAPARIEVAAADDRAVARLPPGLDVSAFAPHLPYVAAKGVPVLRPASVLTRMAATPTRVRSWASALEWLPEVAAEAVVSDVLTELGGRPATVSARLGYLLHEELATYRRRLVNAVSVLGLVAPALAVEQIRSLIAGFAALCPDGTVNAMRMAELLSRAPDASPRESVVADWRETTWEYGHAYLTTPRDELLDDLMADFAVLQLNLAAATNDQVGRELSDSASRLAALIAMVYTDSGYSREARHAWQRARRLADDSGSVDTRLWVCGQEAITGLYLGRPLPVVHRLIEQALPAATGKPLPGVAILLAARTQALALEGSEAALALLPRFRDTFDRLPDTSAFADSIFGWSHGRLCHTESFVRALCGPSPLAYQAHAHATAKTKPARTGSHCQIQLHRAIRLIRDGDISTGVSHATQALDRLPRSNNGCYIMMIARAAFARIPPSEARRPAVLDFRDRLVEPYARRTGGHP